LKIIISKTYIVAKVRLYHYDAFLDLCLFYIIKLHIFSLNDHALILRYHKTGELINC